MALKPSSNGWTNGNGVAHHDFFLDEVVKILREEGAIDPSRNISVLDYKSPKDLQESLSLDLGKATPSDDDLLELCRDMTKASVKTNHPHFHNQLYAGVDPYGLAGAWITEALNTNQYTFEVGPVFTLVENAVVKHILKIVGYTDGDGIFAPGGSSSNMYGMVLARYKAAPEIKTKGNSCVAPLVCFTSEDAHYSILKGAHWLGLGTDNVIRIKTDKGGRMIPSELDARIQESKDAGKLPFVVVASAGTTVLGSFDPLDELAEVCQKHGVWLHVDACWGGTLLLSKTHSKQLRGLNKADSFSWNPHKMLGAPLQCSAFLVKEKGLLHRCNSAAATYLFQQDKFYDVSFDTGDKSVQCGRKVDAFKLWLMWKARGDAGFEKLVDNTMDCAKYFRDQIRNRAGFRLVWADIQCTNVCFWYIPPSLRGLEETDEWWEKVHTVAPKLKEKLIMNGSVMIGYQPMTHKGLKNFFRMVTTCQPPTLIKDMDHVISEIERYGAKLQL